MFHLKELEATSKGGVSSTMSPIEAPVKGMILLPPIDRCLKPRHPPQEALGFFQQSQQALG